MLKERVKILQKLLFLRGFTEVKDDGIPGAKTMKAIHSLPGINPGFSDEKKLVAAIQILAKEKNIDTGEVDGLWGPSTAFAFESLVHFLKYGSNPKIWRPDEPMAIPNPNQWPKQNEQSLNAYYGPPGESQLTNLILPYPHRLSWDVKTVVNKIRCHKKVKESLERVLSQVVNHYGIEEIKRLRLDIWGGCYALRAKRGGSSPSTHSWGIAMDYDPDRNQLKWGGERASLARPEFEAWWQIWESEGWVSLGRSRNFDWMHVQAALL